MVITFETDTVGLFSLPTTIVVTPTGGKWFVTHRLWRVDRGLDPIEIEGSFNHHNKDKWFLLSLQVSPVWLERVHCVDQCRPRIEYWWYHLDPTQGSLLVVFVTPSRIRLLRGENPPFLLRSVLLESSISLSLLLRTVIQWAESRRTEGQVLLRLFSTSGGGGVGRPKPLGRESENVGI